MSRFLALVTSAYHLLLQPLKMILPLLNSSPAGLEGSRNDRWLIDQEVLKNFTLRRTKHDVWIDPGKTVLVMQP